MGYYIVQCIFCRNLGTLFPGHWATFPPRCVVKKKPKKPEANPNVDNDATTTNDAKPLQEEEPELQHDVDAENDEDDGTTCEVAAYMELLFELMHQMEPFFKSQGEKKWNYDEQAAHKYFFKTAGKKI